MASNGDKLVLRRKDVREQIARSFATALNGVAAQTGGMIKLAESRLRQAMHGDRAPRAGLVSDLRSKSRIGLNHKEDLAILAVDMRGSTALAEKHKADKVFVLMQCFIPLMAFIVQALDGEVSDSVVTVLIAAFGFTEKTWRPCLNRAYEAGGLMIQANGEELAP